MWEAGARSPQSILISWSNRSPYIQPPRLSISMVSSFHNYNTRIEHLHRQN